MNDLEKYFNENTGRRIHKWKHYFDVYDRHFARYRDTEVHVVEFGISQGGSLEMWKDYFGPKCHIYGVDINERCKVFEEDRVKVFTGDQGDRAFLRSLGEAIPRIDILIDDGGHTMQQQICTFEELFPKIENDGVYFCEDCHTSYRRKFGGGYKRRGSFIEYAKNFVDAVNAWHSKTPRLQVTDFTRSSRSVHFYDSIVVVEKGDVDEPVNLKTGELQIPDYHPPKRIDKRFFDAVKNPIRKMLGSEKKKK